jgi:hypothetical protein
MLEGFGWHEAESDWVLGCNRAIKLTAAGKFIIVQSYPDSSGQGLVANRDFLLATYLLIKGGHTFINLAGSGVNWIPEYQIDFGAPAQALPGDVSSYRQSNGLYQRDFQKGTVLVNPSPNPISVMLSTMMYQVSATGGGTVTDSDLDAQGNYVSGSLAYSAVTSLTLQPLTAALLLTQKP